MDLPDLPQTYWKYRRGMALWSLGAGMLYAIGVLIAYALTDISDFPLVGFSTVFLGFLSLPIIIYMLGATREDLERMRKIIEVIKQ